MNKYDALDLAFDAINKLFQPKQLLSADREYLCKQLEPIVEAYKILKGENHTTEQKQKPTAWSEEDERLYRGLQGLIYSTPYCNSRKKISDWLKSLKDRVIPLYL